MVYKMVFYAVWAAVTFGMFITKEASFTSFCLIQGFFAVGAAHIELLSLILERIGDNMEIEIEEDDNLNLLKGDDDDGK